MKRYYVYLKMHGALEISELLTLCQLIETYCPQSATTLMEDEMQLEIPKDKLLEERWGIREDNFFEGLKLLGLITDWELDASKADIIV